MYFYTYMNIQIYICIPMHIHMCVYLHACTLIHQHTHMHGCKCILSTGMIQSWDTFKLHHLAESGIVADEGLRNFDAITLLCLQIHVFLGLASTLSGRHIWHLLFLRGKISMCIKDKPDYVCVSVCMHVCSRASVSIFIVSVRVRACA